MRLSQPSLHVPPGATAPETDALPSTSRCSGWGLTTPSASSTGLGLARPARVLGRGASPSILAALVLLQAHSLPGTDSGSLKALVSQHSLGFPNVACVFPGEIRHGVVRIDHVRGSRGDPDDPWILPDLVLLPASGLKDSWMPRTLFMSHSSSARGN